MADHHDDGHGGGHGGGKADHGGGKGGGGGKAGEKAGTAVAIAAIGGYILWSAASSLLGLNPPSYQTLGNTPRVSMRDVVARQCNGVSSTVELGSDAVVFNPAALCSSTLNVIAGAVELNGPLGSIIMQPNEKRADLSDMWFETARAVDGHAVLSFTLTQ